MKQGAGDDLLDDVDPTNAQDDEQDEQPDGETGPERRPRPDSATESSDTIPYLLRRNRVKEGRETVGFGLQKETRDLENDILRRVKADLDVEKIHTTDLREAAYLAGLQNPELVKDILLEWGYEHRR